MNEQARAVSEGKTAAVGWRHWLALNASTGALLGAILLVGMSTELWAPLLPEYLKGLQAPILLIALYGCGKDALEAVAYFLGGTLAARFNTRRALLIFGALPLVGLAILLAWESRYAIFVALPFVGIWNSIAGPATLRVVGDTLSTSRRSMAFSLQSIQKRLSNILANVASGGLVVALGELQGVRAGIALAMVFVVLGWLLQYHYMRTAVVDHAPALRNPVKLLGEFDPQLRRLLVSDVLARWCDGLVREYAVLYCIAALVDAEGWSIADAAAAYVSILLAVMNTTSLLLYVPIGHLASKEGAAKKPFIGLTFICFALFPLALLLFGPAGGLWGLVAAFVMGGLREIGEPARKAMVTELAPHAFRTQAIGVYWSARSVGVMLAPLVGGLLWVNLGPDVLLGCAGAVGLAGAAWFYLRFAGASAARRAAEGQA